MDDRQRLKRQIEAADFAENNGAMIRVINILDGEWVRLSTMRNALVELDNSDFEESLVYLQKSEYVEIRSIIPGQPTDVYKADKKTCEVSLTAKGMRLARCIDIDPAVKV